ncbi:MAG: hypothetical protein WKF86_00260 [Acidimicrobiales bacterium]
MTAAVADLEARAKVEPHLTRVYETGDRTIGVVCWALCSCSWNGGRRPSYTLADQDASAHHDEVRREALVPS